MIRHDFKAIGAAADDLMTAGLRGYCRALDSFDPSRGVPLRLWMRRNARWAMCAAAARAAAERKRLDRVAAMWPAQILCDELVTSRIGALPATLRAVALARLSPWLEDRRTQAALSVQLGVTQPCISYREQRARRLLIAMNAAWTSYGPEDPPPGAIKCFRPPTVASVTMRLRGKDGPRVPVIEMSSTEREQLDRWAAQVTARATVRRNER
jgi:hypothetical protein